MGKTKADVMPPLPANEYWSARLNWIGFWLFGATMLGITVIFFLGDILMTGRLVSVGILAIYDRLRSHVYGTPEQIAAYRPQVAVLIPAYNEEKVIERTIQGALDSDYPKLARDRHRRRLQGSHAGNRPPRVCRGRSGRPSY